MDDCADLVVTPFRDIVEKAKAAALNARSQQPMLQSAISLLREGERALKRIEPLCKKHLDDYGSNFIDALKDSDEISSHRSQLTDLLWEFDDHVELDGFDAQKFADLQALSRKAAPRIYDILMRMKLDAPPPRPHHHARHLSMPHLSAPPSPRASSSTLLPLELNRSSCASDGSSSRADSKSPPEIVASAGPAVPAAPTASTPPPPPPPTTTRQAPAGPESTPAGPYSWPAPAPAPAPAPPNRGPPPDPASPAEDDLQLLPPFSPENPARCESPVDPALLPMRGPGRASTRLSNPIRWTPPPVAPASTPVLANANPADAMAAAESSPLLIYSSPRNSISPPSASRPRALPGLKCIPGEELGDWVTPSSSQPLYQLFYSPVTSHTHPLPALSYETSPVLPTPTLRPPSLPPAGTCLPDGATGDNSTSLLQHPHTMTASRQSVQPMPADHQPSDSKRDEAQPGLELATLAMLESRPDAGLIPVEPSQERPSPKQPGSPLTSTDNCIMGGTSSFYLSKGFCDGAKAVTRGEIGVKKTKRPSFTTTATVAKCTGCLLELDFNQIEVDVKELDDGNLFRCGIGYRLRFLQKSHLSAKRVDDILYGCVFCVHQGRTLDPTDATVFFTARALFEHIKRHPRPLPKVPGIIVIEEEDGGKQAEDDESKKMTDSPVGQLRKNNDKSNNYDLRLKTMPAPHPALVNADEIAGLPTGVARDQTRKIYGQRLPFDRSQVLELAQGARVAGICWPVKYNGDWCLGWHDGVFAALPTDLIRLEAPPMSEIRMGCTSHVSAKARWKFAPREKERGEWLKFDKDDTITNISWSHAEHWCWSGHNSKGRWGIFPRAFIDATTVREISDEGRDRAATLSSERNRSSSMLALFSAWRPSAHHPSALSETSNSLGHLSRT